MSLYLPHGRIVAVVERHRGSRDDLSTFRAEGGVVMLSALLLRGLSGLGARSIHMPDSSTPTIAHSLWQSLASFLVGAFVTQVWNKFRTRTTVLRYFVYHYPAGSTVTDPRLGSVKVLYNETEVKNLYVSTVTLSNDSGRDLEDLVLNIESDPGSMIIEAHGRNQASLNDLRATEEFSNALTVAGQTMNYEPVAKRRDYQVPVLNRGDDLQVVLLTTNFKGNQPFLRVACDKPGVKLQQGTKRPELFGEPRDSSAAIGALIALGLCWPVVVWVPNKSVAVIAASVLGMTCIMLGVGVRKMVRVVVRLLS